MLNIKKVLFKQKDKVPEFDYIPTLTKDETKDYIKSLDLITREANQLYRANHGGGMPCPENIATYYHGVLDIF